MLTQKTRSSTLTTAVAAFVAAIVSTSACMPLDNSAGNANDGHFVLLADQNIPVGMVIVTSYADEIFVEYELNGDWCLIETHVHSGIALDDFPLAGRSGNPVPGDFAHRASHACVQHYEEIVPLGKWDPESPKRLIAAKASIEQVNGRRSATAWADGERFTDRGNWATYFEYVVPTYLATITTDKIDPWRFAHFVKGDDEPEDLFLRAGEEVAVEARADNVRIDFGHWSATPDSPDSFEDPTAATTVFTMPSEDTVLTAHFQEFGQFNALVREMNGIPIERDPIAGARVSIEGTDIEGFTNDFGWTGYLIVPVGSHNIIASKDGYETGIQTIHVPNWHSSSVLIFDLEPLSENNE